MDSVFPRNQTVRHQREENVIIDHFEVFNTYVKFGFPNSVTTLFN
jgi:hypothetical protein